MAVILFDEVVEEGLVFDLPTLSIATEIKQDNISYNKHYGTCRCILPCGLRVPEKLPCRMHAARRLGSRIAQNPIRTRAADDQRAYDSQLQLTASLPDCHPGHDAPD